MDIKELQQKSGMNQRQFAEYFSIPLRTLENWIGNSQANKHKCPEYLLDLMIYKLRNEGIITD